jgi:hypothetical protein
MRGKVIRNGEPAFPSVTYSGPCKLDGRNADVTSYFRCSKECRTDLQKTYRFSGYKCSLQEEKDHTNPACMGSCPLIQKEYL